MSGACQVYPTSVLSGDTNLTYDILYDIGNPVVRVSANAITNTELAPNQTFQKFASNLDFNSHTATENLKSTALSSEDVTTTSTTGITTNEAAGSLIQADGSGNCIWFNPNASDNVIPSGAMIMHVSSVTPSGWVACNGAALSRSGYAALFSAIGVTYGLGDGSTTFNVPNMCCCKPVGSGVNTLATFKTAGQTGGTEFANLSAANLPAHSHGMKMSPYSGQHQNGVQPAGVYPMVTGETDNQTQPSGNGAEVNVLNPFLALMFYIKT